MELFPLRDFPLVKEGDSIPELIVRAAEKTGIRLKDGDILVICQSIVSKSEGRVVDLNRVKPGDLSRRVARRLGKDPREMEVILSESAEIVRLAHVIISRTKHGFVCANAGVDRSNAPPGCVTLLPDNPDRSAERIRRSLKRRLGINIGVIITDTQGRPFRLGGIGVAVGVSGVKPLLDLRGRRDIYGRKLVSTIVSPADAIAAAAVLLMGEAGERTPVIVVRGAPRFVLGEGRISDLIMPRERDLFA